MPDLCMLFEVHQPLRLNRNFHFDLAAQYQITAKDLDRLYFDHQLNKDVFNRIARKCYMPANNVLLQQVDRLKKEKKKFKVAFSLSGVFVEQCERWNPDLLDSYKQLVDSQCVELLDQTYYHSLAGLYDPEWSEFVEQVRMHRRLMKETFGCSPKIFENTECIYNNNIAKKAEELGFEAIFTEGADRILGWRSPNYVYRSKDAHIAVLLRNYRLSDDVGFRFTSSNWNGWPLTADKFATWLSHTPGEAIAIFLDYETLGEHYWTQTGILEFLRWLPIEVEKHDNLQWNTPSEIVRNHIPVGEIDVPPDQTVSWADTARDIGAWLANSHQRTSFNLMKDLSSPVNEMNSEEFLKIWRSLQTSDHFYYMYTKGDQSDIVHDTFNPYGNPMEAFITYVNIVLDFQARCQLEIKKPEFKYKRLLRRLPPEKGFKFYYGFARPVGLISYSLGEFLSIVKILGDESIVFHMERGDFERWLGQVVGDETLPAKVSQLVKEKVDLGSMREKLSAVVRNRIEELERLAATS